MTEIYPNDTNQTILAYNVLITIILIGTAVLVHFGIILPFIVALIIAGALVWDMYLLPYFRPDTKVEDEEVVLDRQLAQWVEGQDDKFKVQILARLTKLEAQLKGREK